MAKLTDRRELNVKTAAMFYEARATLRTCLGAEYEETMRPWLEKLRQIADKYHRGNVLDAALPIAEELKEQGEEVGILIILAACVELIEPAAEVKHEGTK